MNITTRQKMILLGIQRDIDQLAPLAIPTGYGTFGRAEVIQMARDGIVRSNPSAWLQRGLTPSDYVMLTRDYKQLEAKGLIERLRLGMDGLKPTHIALTDSGREVVRQLAATEASNG